MNILIDCDDVLLDWQAGFRRWLRDERGINPHPSGPTSWNMSTWLGLDDDECLAAINHFNASIDFEHLPSVAGAAPSLSDLKDAGHDLYVITSCGDHPATIVRRCRNLHRHFGEIFSEIICVPLGVSKQSHLQGFEPSIWIEDNYKHALAGLQCGHRTFMLRRNHNRNDEMGSQGQIKWVDDWGEIVSLIST